MAQRHVSHRMAIGVVDALEMIDVDHPDIEQIVVAAA
jgi:hypothetical protein